MEKRFILGGIKECFMFSLIISVFYLGIQILSYSIFEIFIFPTFYDSGFISFILVLFASFLILVLLELFIFERDLNWNGRTKPKTKSS